MTSSALFEPLSSTAAKSRLVGAAGAVVSGFFPPSATASPPKAPAPRTPRPILPPGKLPEKLFVSEAGVSLFCFSAGGAVSPEGPFAELSTITALSAVPSRRVSCSWPFSTKETTTSSPSIRTFAFATLKPVLVSITSILAPRNWPSSLTLAPKDTSLTRPFLDVNRITLDIQASFSCEFGGLSVHQKIDPQF